MANPNPSPEHQFKPGQSGNPGGKTSEQRKAEVRAAELSALLRVQMLEEMAEAVAEGRALDHLKADALRLFKDSEDRAHGTPTNKNEHAGAGGGPIVWEFL